MKHTVHVTVTIAVEVDSNDIQREFGKCTNKLILEHALNNFNCKYAFDSRAKIHESYEEKLRPRKGIGSY